MKEAYNRGRLVYSSDDANITSNNKNNEKRYNSKERNSNTSNNKKNNARMINSLPKRSIQQDKTNSNRQNITNSPLSSHASLKNHQKNIMLSSTSRLTQNNSNATTIGDIYALPTRKSILNNSRTLR